MRPLAPRFSRIYGIHPWDLDRLTFGERDLYLEDLKQRIQGGE